jgi:hypothetical protein
MTPWFPPNIKPMHVGVYPAAISVDRGFAHWNGRKWGCLWATKKHAKSAPAYDLARQDKSWRGFTEKP